MIVEFDDSRDRFRPNREGGIMKFEYDAIVTKEDDTGNIVYAYNSDLTEEFELGPDSTTSDYFPIIHY
ncbi:MAG: hypothetical protein GX760_06015 [Erysipelothrix sp.]|nr:hypothetical protein [Erysipelothrix sp.]